MTNTNQNTRQCLAYHTRLSLQYISLFVYTSYRRQVSWETRAMSWHS